MDLPYKTITKSAQDTQKLGQIIGHSLLKGESKFSRIICLWGELGSGKTTFVQGLAKGLGITGRLLSPTFIIVRRYDVPDTLLYLYHMDAYRMKSESDVEGVGFTEMLAHPQALVIVEWPERLGRLLPKHRLDIHFETLADDDHHIDIQNI